VHQPGGRKRQRGVNLCWAEKENFMYIAQGGVVDHKIQGRTRMQFRMGEEVMVVPYGCLHAH
jgi:hypothetical protein